MELFHGTDETFKIHRGLCLTNTDYTAKDYGSNLTKVWLEVSSLNLVNVDHLVDYENQDFPGDTEASLGRLESEGIDVAVFQDSTPTGKSHLCYRLVSQKALNSLKVEE